MKNRVLQNTARESETVKGENAWKGMVSLYIADKRGLLPSSMVSQLDRMSEGMPKDWRSHVESELSLSRKEIAMLQTTKGLNGDAEAIASWLVFVRSQRDTGHVNLPSEPPELSKSDLLAELSRTGLSPWQMHAYHMICSSQSGATDPEKEKKEMNLGAAYQALFLAKKKVTKEFSEGVKKVILKCQKEKGKGKVNEDKVLELVKEYIPIGF